MGNNLCKSKSSTKREAEFYYKSVMGNDLDIQNAKEKVQLSISLFNVSEYSNYEVSLITFTSPNQSSYVSWGKTESQSPKEQKITFDKFFVMDYYFEKNQLIAFQIVDLTNRKSTQIELTIGSIMGSRKQHWEKPVSMDKIILCVNGRSLENNNLQLVANVELEGNFNRKHLYYVVKSLGTQSNPSNVRIYKSEVIAGNATAFMQVEIPIMFLLVSKLSDENAFNNNYVGIEIYEASKSKKWGEHIAPLSTLTANKSCINLNIPQVRALLNCKVRKTYTFLDFLKGGMQIALTIGIDFTASNMSPSDPNSLHKLSDTMNSYEKAIRACGDIVAYYDYDQLFPVFGYGAILPGTNDVNHCFPINLNMNDPNINTIDGVLYCYRNVLPMIKLSGPTYFAPIIRELNNTVKNDLKNGNSLTYNIWMILTDGQINDMDATIDELVEASYLPISVIIIGIGMADFGNMEILDADYNPLYDSNKRKAARDLVQFVPFNEYQNNGELWAEQVWEEVPRQVVDYYKMNNIIPSDPIIPLPLGI